MKLEIESVAFKNFLSFGSKVQEVEFLHGLNLVSGIDVDKNKSNGAGKSSFLETLPFGFFGKVHRNIKKDQIINWKNRKNCEVILNFRIEKDGYSILRAIKPNKLELYKNGSLIDRPAHVKDYQQIIEEILQINFQTFMSVVHSNINSSAKILSMKKPDKRKFMETMFGLEVYTKLNEKCNSKLKALKDKIREIDIVNSANKTTLNDINQRTLALHEQNKKLLIPQQEFKEASEKLKELEDDFPDIIDDLNELTSENDQLISDVQYNDHLVRLIKSGPKLRFETKLDSIKKSVKETESKIESLKNYDILVKNHGTADEIIEKVDKLNEGLLKISENISKTKIKISVLEGNISTCIKDTKNIERKIKILSQDKCPECGQKIESADLLIFQEQELELIKEDIKKYNIEKIDLQMEEVKSQEMNKKVSAKSAELSKIRRKILDKREQSNGVTTVDYEKWKKDIGRYERTLSKLSKLQNGLVKENGVWSRESYLIMGKMEDLKRNSERIKQLQNNMRQLEIKAEAVDSNLKQNYEMIYTEEMKVRKIIEGIEVSEKKKEKTSNIRDYLEYIKFICKDENIKQEAISSIMPFMTKKTNFYLSEVDYSFYAVLDRWLDAEIKGAGITNASYGSLSGGEGRGIDIALQLAFLDVAKVQAGIFPDFLTFDELLDSSIDSSGITELFKIVKTKQKEDNSKVFIISHRSELDNMDDIDNIYEVIKENGYSRVAVRN